MHANFFPVKSALVKEYTCAIHSHTHLSLGGSVKANYVLFERYEVAPVI